MPIYTIGFALEEQLGGISYWFKKKKNSAGQYKGYERWHLEPKNSSFTL